MSSQYCADCGESIAAYLRVAALAVGTYDWIWTLPVELDIYREQQSIFHLGRACILFIMIRYTSIATLIAGNVGFFRTGWSPEACHHFLYAPPVLKSIQMLSAHTILFVRTWAISRRSKRVFWSLLSLMIIAFITELWSSVYKRVPAQDESMNCTSGNEPGSKVSWIFYLMSTLFDLACLCTASFFLYDQTTTKGLHSLSHSLLKEGLLFFLVLHAINVANLVVYLKGSLDAESAAASLGYTLTWIMAQRILIQLHKLRGTTMRSRSRSTSGGLGEPSHAPKFASRALTNRMTSTNPGDVELSGVHVAVHVEEHLHHSDVAWDGASAADDADPTKVDDSKVSGPLSGSAHVVFP